MDESHAAGSPPVGILPSVYTVTALSQGFVTTVGHTPGLSPFVFESGSVGTPRTQEDRHTHIADDASACAETAREARSKPAVHTVRILLQVLRRTAEFVRAAGESRTIMSRAGDGFASVRAACKCPLKRMRIGEGVPPREVGYIQYLWSGHLR